MSGLSIHAALPFLSTETSSVSPQRILPVYKTIEPFQWFLIGQLVTRRVKLLATKGITPVEQIALVLIKTTVLGTVATASKVTKGTHTSKTVAKVYIQFTYISRYRTFFKEQLRKEKQSNTFLTNF